MKTGQTIKRILLAILLIIMVVMLYRWLSSDKEIEVKEEATASQNQQYDMPELMANDDTQTMNNNGSGQSGTFVTGVENLPRSLQGTDVDGEIIIDGNKNLVPTRGLRRLFDYFLSAMGEESAQTIDARVETYIKSHTPEPAASTAVALYHQYKTYLQQLSAVQERYGNLQLQATQAGELDLNTIRQRQFEVKSIRNQLFNPETVQAFFETDDQLHDYNVAMIEIAKNDNMTEEQKRQARLDYVSRLSDPTIKERVLQKENMETLMTRTERLKQSGASDSELFAMRAELVGIPAAERLAEVDQKNKDFDSRFEQYRSAKQRIMTTTNDKATQQAQIKELEQQLFNEAEQKRLAGYAQLKSQQ